MTVYVVYSGDEVVATGTAEECAEQMDVKPETVRWYATPSGKRRCNMSAERVEVEG